MEHAIDKDQKRGENLKTLTDQQLSTDGGV
jgi:hypothetical protein